MNFFPPFSFFCLLLYTLLFSLLRIFSYPSYYSVSLYRSFSRAFLFRRAATILGRPLFARYISGSAKIISLLCRKLACVRFVICDVPHSYFVCISGAIYPSRFIICVVCTEWRGNKAFDDTIKRVSRYILRRIYYKRVMLLIFFHEIFSLKISQRY